MQCKRAVIMALLVLLVVLSVMHAQAQTQTAATVGDTPVQWKSMSESSIELVYQPTDEEFARQLLPRVVAARQEALRNAQAVLAKQKGMNVHRTQILRYMASMLGMPRPGRAMSHAYDDCLHNNESIYRLLSNITRFQLWHDDLPVTALQNGERIPGMTYDSAANVVRLDLLVIGSPRDRKASFPVVYQQGDTVDYVAGNTFANLMMFSQVMSPHAIFHEAAEIGIVKDFGMSSAYRRWFCDGLAEYVAMQTLNKFLGRDAYEQEMRGRDPASYSSLLPQVDLLAWRAAEYQAMPDMPRDALSLAHYCFAFQEIRGLAERHGADVVAKVMRQLAKTRKEQRDSHAILAAIHTVTGEDMAARLGAYGKEANQDLRGVAICNVNYSLKTEKHAKPSKLSTGGQVVLDGKQDIQVDFRYGILDDQATAQLVLGNETWSHSFDVLLDGKSSDISFCLDLPKYRQEIPAGTYTMCLMLRGKPLTEKLSVSLSKP